MFNPLPTLLTTLPFVFTALALPATSTPGNTLVALIMYNTTDCSDDGMLLNLYGDQCMPMPPLCALKVIYHDQGLFYNALRTYDIDECGGGWSLQPLNGDCFQYVGDDKSIQVVTGNN